MTGQAYLGCYGGHFFAVDLRYMSIVPESKIQLQQGIYDMAIMPDQTGTVMLCQHFGFIDFVETATF